MQFSDAEKPSNRIISLIGPPKQGKTVCAGTISAFMPDEIPAQGFAEKTYLKDTVWLQFDSDGVESLRQLNVFPMLEDLSGFTTLPLLKKGFTASVERIKAAVTSGEVKYVVVDTVTALDKVIVHECTKQCDDNRVYGMITARHMDYCMALKALPCTVIVIMHTKYIGAFGGQETPEQLARKRAGGMPGRAEIGMALSNGAADYWRTQSNAILPVYSVGGAKDKKYTILTESSRGFECGHRYKGLAEEEPAHLRKLLQKAGAY